MLLPRREAVGRGVLSLLLKYWAGLACNEQISLEMQNACLRFRILTVLTMEGSGVNIARED